jgi:hypothetical protein
MYWDIDHYSAKAYPEAGEQPIYPLGLTGIVVRRVNTDMTENKESRVRRIIRSNRFYWLLAILALPLPAILAYSLFPIGCLCPYGSATADVFQKGICLIWIRLFVGLALGENKKKTLIYLVLPFVIGLLISTIGPLIWPDAHG